MKKNLILLFSLFFLTNCSLIADSSLSFVGNLVNGNYYLVAYTSEKTGITHTVTNINPIDEKDIKIFEVEEFKTVARVDTSSPLRLVYSNGAYTGSFTHNDTLYTYEHVNSSNSAVYSYTFFSRSETDSPSLKAYIGFIIQNNGLYVAQRKDTNTGTTAESTIAFYSENNIDFSAVDDGPLYQKLGTTPVF